MIQGTYYSPYFPYQYVNNRTCGTLIMNDFSVGNDTLLQLQVHKFSLEDSKNCSHDSVTIYDGDNETFPLIGRYCGNKFPIFMQSTGANLFAVFESDFNKTSTGFSINVRYRKGMCM